MKYKSTIDGLEQQSKLSILLNTICRYTCSPEKFQSILKSFSEIPEFINNINVAYRNNDMNTIINMLNTPAVSNIFKEYSSDCSKEKIETTLNEISAIPGMMDSINLSIQNNDVQKFVNLIHNPSIISIFDKNIPTCRFPKLVRDIAQYKGIKPILEPNTNYATNETTKIPTGAPSIPLNKFYLNSSYGPLCLDGKDKTISMYPCNNSTSQEWYQDKTNNQYTYLMNNYTHNCLDVKNNTLTMTNCNNNSSQKWKYPPKNKAISNLFTPNMCLDGTSNNLIMKQCDSTINQQWLIN
jgi:hypothetical protein